jgi:hypothetical protein
MIKKVFTFFVIKQSGFLFKIFHNCQNWSISKFHSKYLTAFFCVEVLTDPYINMSEKDKRNQKVKPMKVRLNPFFYKAILIFKNIEPTNLLPMLFFAIIADPTMVREILFRFQKS